jgi:hypothetical protein
LRDVLYTFSDLKGDEDTKDSHQGSGLLACLIYGELNSHDMGWQSEPSDALAHASRYKASWLRSLGNKHLHISFRMCEEVHSDRTLPYQPHCFPCSSLRTCWVTGSDERSLLQDARAVLSRSQIPSPSRLERIGHCGGSTSPNPSEPLTAGWCDDHQ